MPRYTLMEEQKDVPPADIFFIAKDSLWWDDDVALPVFMDAPHRTVIGKAYDLKREGCLITAQIDEDMPDDPDFAVMLLNAKMHDFKGTRFISDGKIVEVLVAEKYNPSMPHLSE